MEQLLDFLADNGVVYERFDHPAVFTCEESHKLPPMPGMPTKNLFLRNEKGDHFFLVTVGHAKSADLKALKAVLGVSKLSFGSPESLKQLLGVEPGSVTLFGVLHDKEHKVQVILDSDIAAADALQCHPLVNTGTLVISAQHMRKFLALTGHEPRTVDVPAREVRQTA